MPVEKFDSRADDYNAKHVQFLNNTSEVTMYKVTYYRGKEIEINIFFWLCLIVTKTCDISISACLSLHPYTSMSAFVYWYSLLWTSLYFILLTYLSIAICLCVWLWDAAILKHEKSLHGALLCSLIVYMFNPASTTIIDWVNSFPCLALGVKMPRVHPGKLLT